MKRGTYNFTITRGDTVVRRFRLKNRLTQAWIDFTGYTGGCQVRPESDESLVGTFVVTTGNDTVAGQGATTGPFILVEGETEGFPVGRVRWDLEMISPDGVIITYVGGIITVQADVTRDG